MSEPLLVGSIEARSGAKVLVVNTLYGNIQTAGAPPSETAAQRERLAAIRRIREDWIDGLLAQSLKNVAHLELNIDTRPAAVEWGLNAVVHVPDRPSARVAPRTDIESIFDSVGESLLVLGDGGSGKTTLLLELAQSLLNRAEQDPTAPVPVVLNLSTWDRKRQPLGSQSPVSQSFASQSFASQSFASQSLASQSLASWMTRELMRRNDIPERLTAEWIKADGIVPLLDGFDEVAQESRLDCLRAINDFRSTHGLVRMAVCSRVAEYEELGEKLRLRNAVVLLPLDPEQVDSALAATPRLSGLREMAARDASLREMLRTPLMLWIAALAFRDTTPGAGLDSGEPDPARRLFAKYVDSMFERRGVKAPFSKEKTLRYARWLARALRRSGSTVFEIEALDWRIVPDRKLRFLAILVVFAIVAVLYGACSIAAAYAGYALSNFLMMALTRVLHVHDLTRTWDDQMTSALLVGAMAAAGLSPLGAMVAVVINPQPVYRTRLTLRQWKDRLLLAATMGIAAGTAAAMYLWFLFKEDPGGMAIYGLAVGLICATSRLLVSNDPGIGSRRQNGIRRSTRIAAGTGALILTLGLFIALRSGLRYWIFSALIGGALAGGLFVLKHFACRIYLWAARTAPLRYRAFLDYGTERILLRKVGNGYVFVHRLLLEYLASGDSPGGPN